MIRTILVPLDGSAFAEQALPLALTIARRANARLHLAIVRPSLPHETAGSAAGWYLRGMASRIESELPGAVVHSVLGDDSGPGVGLPAAADSVADELAHYTEEQDIDLVVMTTHGHGGIVRAWLGSAADAFMRIAPRPVLLIRPGDESFGSAIRADRGLNHIVVPLDGSAAAERAIPVAVRVGAVFGARFTLLRVVSPFTFQVSADLEPSAPLSPLNREAAVQYVNGAASRMRETETSVAAHIIESGSPATAIVDYAETHGADLIVLSSSGAGGVKRLLLGSVADSIVRSTDVPVLVCNARHATEPAAELAGHEGEQVRA